ncbi:MAG TPA: hypothetical protein VJM34_05455 [Novosphingobium sp.]|nr:hypothetical protein [Novosphingobium sp.]
MTLGCFVIATPDLIRGLQAAARMRDARGLPAPFRDFALDGRRVWTARPIRGQTVAP